MRVLGIDSSTAVGSVALWEGGHHVFSATHDQPHQHAEVLLGLLQHALQVAAWSLPTVDRLGVAMGPGSFAGLRVGIALAQGIALGAEKPLVGVGSLQAMAHGATQVQGARCAILDARRNEVFLGVYNPDDSERIAPCSVAKANLAEWIRQRSASLAFTVVGDRTLRPEPGIPWCSVPATPHARWVAELAAQVHVVDSHYTLPVHYVRAPDLIRPNLPPSPLERERTA